MSSSSTADLRLRVAVVGAGSMGCKFGAFLTQVADVWLIHHRDEAILPIVEQGLVISRDGVEQVYRVNATVSPSEIGPVDLAIMFVKSYDTDTALERLTPILRDDSMVLTLQNGLGNAEKIAARVGSARTAIGITYQASLRVRPGLVEDRGRGMTYLETRPEVDDRMRRIGAAFNQADLPTELSESAESLIWGKLMINVGLNALATILRVPNHVLEDVPEVRELAHAAMDEAQRIVAAKGITLPYEPKAQFAKVMRDTASMRSSTLLDALSGRRTEIDVLNGAVVREGAALGIPTPVNDLVVRLVKAIEATHPYRVQDGASD